MQKPEKRFQRLKIEQSPAQETLFGFKCILSEFIRINFLLFQVFKLLFDIGAVGNKCKTNGDILLHVVQFVQKHRLVFIVAGSEMLAVNPVHYAHGFIVAF